MTTTLPHLSHPRYRPDIDGLRAIAVLPVVAFHAFPTWMKGGFIGVDVFFVISGFLISTIIFENLDKGTFSFTEFYARRVRRIFPALTVVLIACMIFGWLVLLPDELNQLGKHIVAGTGFVSNLILWNEVGYFDNSAETKPLLHLWSLGIEEQFYIVWPLLLWLAWRWRFNLLILASMIAILSFALSVKGIKQDPAATFYSPLTRFWELLCGTLLAWHSLQKADLSRNVKKLLANFSPTKIFITNNLLKENTRIRNQNYRLISNAFSFSGLLLLGYGFLKINKDLSFPGYWALIPVLGTALIIQAGPQAWFNQKILSNKLLIWFGLISFPLYLWHWPILSFGQIIYFDVPPLKFRVIAVTTSIFLAWFTVKLVEKPFRFGSERTTLKVVTLSAMAFTVGTIGLIINKADFSDSHKFNKLTIKRKEEHVIGSSLAWYRGKGDWLFLGNAYNNTIAKLKLSIIPSNSQIQTTKKSFSKIASAALKYNTKLVLVVGPNKSSIYPEYLPDGLIPSTKKYSSFFLDKLKEVPNLTIYDPTDDLLRLKNSEGTLYWMTDTHWNNKGAFLAYSGFSKILGLPIPDVEFQIGKIHSGDLIEISKLKAFPLHAEDNWEVVWKDKPIWTEKEIANEQKTTFGTSQFVSNDNPLSDKYIWVVGDSFSGALKQYFNATFKEIRYVGYSENRLNDLPLELVNASRKPDMIIVVRVERSF